MDAGEDRHPTIKIEDCLAGAAKIEPLPPERWFGRKVLVPMAHQLAGHLKREDMVEAIRVMQRMEYMAFNELVKRLSLLILVLSVTGCELVQAFFGGASEAVVEAAPEITQDALSGNWVGATVGLIVTAVVGGFLELGRRRRKRKARAAFLKGTPPGRKKK